MAAKPAHGINNIITSRKVKKKKDFTDNMRTGNIKQENYVDVGWCCCLGIASWAEMLRMTAWLMGDKASPTARDSSEVPHRKRRSQLVFEQ